MISSVKAVYHGKSDGFATGEEVGSSPHMEVRVCYYDLGSATSVANLQPEMHFTGHGDLVTCVTYTPLHPMMLFSGSRDEVIRIWDRRTGNSAGLLGTDTAGKVQELILFSGNSLQLIYSMGVAPAKKRT